MGSTHMIIWTPALDAIVKAGYEAGKPVAVIMAEIGPDCTRGMITGRARRLNAKHALVHGGARKRKPEPKRRQRSMAPPPPPVIGAVGNVAAAVVALWGRDQCRWIDGDVMDGGGIAFCQNAAHRGSWCRAHRAVVFRPVDAVAEKYGRGPGGQRGTTP